MSRTLFFLVLVAPLVLAGPSRAANLKDLNWLSGNWVATGESHVEEIWTTPRAGSMTGMFRLVNGDKLRVLEYMVIAQEKDGIYYRFKHFKADYGTWEGEDAPLTFKMTDSGDGRAVFKNIKENENQPAYISYLLDEGGALTILVGGAPGESENSETIKFVLRRP